MIPFELIVVIIAISTFIAIFLAITSLTDQDTYFLMFTLVLFVVVLLLISWCSIASNHRISTIVDTELVTINNTQICSIDDNILNVTLNSGKIWTTNKVRIITYDMSSYGIKFRPKYKFESIDEPQKDIEKKYDE